MEYFLKIFNIIIIYLKKGMIINMPNFYEPYPCPYSPNSAMFNLMNMYNPYGACPCCFNHKQHNLESLGQLTNPNMYYNDNMYYNPDYTNLNPMRSMDATELKDYGPKPFVTNIEETTLENNNYRTALWTGKHLQATLMKINVGEDIGLEIHPDTDQFLRIEQGQGIAKMGATKDNLDFQRKVSDNFAIFVPAGTWHNVINTGRVPLKLYSIYAPPHHPHGIVEQTKAIADIKEK
jgi:mannose-6-phosphate isomerase-like protein (cupin superfamily)